MNMNIHGCKRLLVSLHQPDNCNAIEITIVHEASGLNGDDNYDSITTRQAITLYDLPTEVTDKLIEALRDDAQAEAA